MSSTSVLENSEFFPSVLESLLTNTLLQEYNELKHFNDAKKSSEIFEK